jgi:hypothetical protein
MGASGCYGFIRGRCCIVNVSISPHILERRGAIDPETNVIDALEVPLRASAPRFEACVMSSLVARLRAEAGNKFEESLERLLAGRTRQTTRSTKRLNGSTRC